MSRVPVQTKNITAWVLCGLLGATVVWASPSPGKHDPIWKDFQTRRLLECRFPDRDRYELFDSENRGRLADLSGEWTEQAALVAQVKQRAERNDPLANRDLVYLSLLTNRLGQAVAEAEQWVTRFPTPEAWNALACAWYEQAIRTSRREKLLDALWALEQVPRESSHSRQTLFNRALVASSLPLPDLARSLWRELQVLEDDTEWRTEVDDRLVELNRPTVSDQWRTDRGWVLATATRKDQVPAESTTERFLRFLEKHLESRLPVSVNQDSGPYRLAERLAQTSGDSLLRRALEVWEQAPRGRRVLLASGHHRYVEAESLQGESSYEQALVAFNAAADALEKGGSPLHGRAVYAAARTEFYLGRFDAAVQRLATLDRREIQDYPRLRAQVAWLLALIHGSQGRLDDQVASLHQARALFMETRDAYGIASIDVLLASVAHRQGRHAEAWRRFLRASSSLVNYGEVRRLHVVWHELAESLLQTSRPAEAKPFIDELLINAEAWGHPAAQAEAWRLAAKVADAQNRSRDAQRALERAYSYSLNVEAPGFSDRIGAALRVAEGEMIAAAEPTRAIQELGTALGTYRKMGYRFYLPRLFTARAQAHAILGDYRNATLDFEQAGGELEQLLESTEEDANRISLLRVSQRVFDAAAQFHLEIGDVDTALAYVERGRRIGAEQDFLGLEDITPPRVDEAYVVYALLTDRLVVFVWRQDRLYLVETETSSDELELSLRALRAAVARREPLTVLEPLLEQLHGWLVQPMLPYLADVRRMVLIPEGFLSEVPFSPCRKRRPPLGRAFRFGDGAKPGLSRQGEASRATAPFEYRVDRGQPGDRP